MIKDFLQKHTLAFLLCFSTLLSLISVVYCYHHGLITAYGDARAHIDISRRVVDNLTPGLAQLGGVWLPLLHVLMLPFVWNDFLWQSGLAGSIVNVPAFILSVYFLYKLLFLITKSRTQSSLGSLVMLLNINLLYLQTTPMTETLFICTLTASVYFLTKWVQDDSVLDLLFSGFAMFLTTLNRYEGWPTAFVAIVIVAILAFKKKKRKEAESRIILYTFVAFLGVGLWFLWQLAIFHNPLYFLHSEFSAEHQTKLLIDQGNIVTYHNSFISLMTYGYALLDVLGWISFLAAFGFVACLLYRRKQKLHLLPIVLFLVPGVFLLYALYKGNIPLSVPQIILSHGKGEYFNIRYALYSLPAVSFFVGYLARKKILQIILFACVFLNAVMLIPHKSGTIATLYDARNSNLSIEDQVGQWLGDHYTSGYVLISAATGDPIMFGTQLYLDHFIHEGSGIYWTQTLAHPGTYATWIVLSNDARDSVNTHINMDGFTTHFIIVKDFGLYKVYKNRFVK